MYRKKILFGSLIAVVCLGLTGVGQAASPNPIGWYKLDDGSGTSVKDATGGGSGTIVATVNWGTGKYGGALVFSGAGYVNLPIDPWNKNITNGSQKYTITFWANVTNTTQATVAFQASNNTADGNHRQANIHMPWSNGSVYFDAAGDAGGAGYRRINGGNSADWSNKWSHWAFTYDASTGREEIWLNDNLYLSTASPSPKVLLAIVALVIGTDGAHATGSNWNGTMDDVRIYNSVLTQAQIQDVMAGGGPTTGMAGGANPANGVTDVLRDAVLSWVPGQSGVKHNVYFGTSFSDVNTASATSPKGVLVSSGQDANSYDPPGVLAFGQTYYWRVDEVNTTADHTVFTGSVWSFTVEPLYYAIKNITATASGVNNAASGPEKTIDGSGLDASDLHGTTDTTMWVSNGVKPAWIQYAFDDVYKVYEMWVWNSNQAIESFVGLGAKDVTVQYSIDGTTWTTLAGVPLFAKAPGAAGYAHNTTVAFGGVAAKYVKLTINSNWGGLAQTGLSEVRFYYKPVQAREPQPATGQTNVGPTVALSWRAGREAISHQVYFGTDANALILAGTVAQNSFTPAVVNLGTTYYWRVDEVNAAETPSLWTGKVWSFSTREYTVIDDMESYNISDNQIFNIWVDGYGTTTNGSQVGYGTSANGTFGETVIVHGGKQSMPLNYNNAGTITYSEAERDWSTAQDWTANGANTLSLWFRGNPVGFQELPSGQILMNGTGTDIYGTADQGRFVYKQLTGNGSIIARVDRLDNTNVWAKAGVMIRETLDAGSSWAYSLASTGNGVHFQARLTTGAGATSDTTLTLPPSQTTAPIPMWVKLERIGNVFNAYYSADGVNWTPNPWNPQTITMNANVYIGLAVTSHQAGAVTQAEFSSISTTGTVTGNWQSVDLGTVAQPAGNTLDMLYVRVVDSTGKSATIKNTDDLAVAAGTWQQWKIPFSSLTGVSANKVKSMIIGIGDRTNPKHGNGLIYIDDVAVGRPTQ